MAKKISKSDIADDDVFGAVKLSAENAIIVLDTLNDTLNESASILSKDIKGAKFGSSKEITEFTKAIREANKIKEDSIKIDQERAKLVQQISKIDQEQEKTAQQKLKTEREEIKNAQILAKEKENEEKIRIRNAKVIADENNAYKKLVKSTRDQKNESKRLASELIHLETTGKKNTKEWRLLNSEYKKITKSAQQGDKALKKIDSTVGDNFRNVGNYRSALGGLTRVMSGLGLAFGGFQLLKGAGETIAEFGQNISDLKAITGAGGEDLEFFKSQAIEMGKGVEGGASAVIEAYKLIASAKPELLDNAKALDAVTKSAITLAQASGMTLPEASIALTDAMNQFGAPAEEAGKFIDVLANGAKFGSAEIPQVTEALLKFGAVAKTSNVSIGESTALIETLAEKGLKGAEAGTALRNVMLKLSAPDALPKEAQEVLTGLGISFEDITDESKPFSERLEALKPLLDDNAGLIKVFGKENAVAGINLIANTDRIEDLTVKMDKNGTATEQATERTDTLSYAFTNLKESWNSWILSLDNATGTGEFLKGILTSIANNIGNIVTWIFKAVLAWGLYKSAIMATRATMFLLNGGIQETIKGMIASVKGLKNMADGAKTAEKGVKSAGNAMKAVPWLLIIGLAIELGQALYFIASGAKAEQEAIEATARAKETADKNVGALKAKEKKRFDESMRLLDLETRKKLSGVKDEQKIQKIKEEELIRKKKIAKQTIDIINKESDAQRKRATIFATAEDEIRKVREGGNMSAKEAIRLQNELASAGLNLSLADIKLGNSLERVSEVRAEAFNEIELLHEANKDFKDVLEDLVVSEIEHKDAIEGAITPTKELKSAQKKLNSEFSDQIDLLKELNGLLQENYDIQNDITQLKIETDIGDIDERIRAEKEAQKISAETTGEINVDLLESLIEEKRKKQIEAINLQAEYEIQKEKDTFNQKFANLQASLDKEKKEKLAQIGLSEEQKAEIIAGYDREQNDLDIFKLAEEENLQNKITLIDLNAGKDRADANRENAEEVKNVNDELIEDQINHSLKLKEVQGKSNEELLAQQKKFAQQTKEIAKAVSDYFIQRSQAKIDQANKEITEAEKNAGILQQLAINGNIKASESLAEQNRIIAEATKKKIAEEKKQQAIKRATLILETYLSKVESNVKNPLGETIRDIGLLTAFMSTITPTFLDGTEDTGTNGSGIDGKGGFHAVLHPNERVLTKEQNKKIGNISNEELATFASDYNTGKIIGNGAIQIGNGWNTGAIVERLESLEQTIKNKPESNIQLTEIVNGAMVITKEVRSGNTSTYNRYKVKG